VTPLYPQKLALTSPTGGSRSVGIVRSRTKATKFSLVLVTYNTLSECGLLWKLSQDCNSPDVRLFCFPFPVSLQHTIWSMFMVWSIYMVRDTNRAIERI